MSAGASTGGGDWWGSLTGSIGDWWGGTDSRQTVGGEANPFYDAGMSGTLSSGWNNLGGQGQSDLITGGMGLFGGLFGDSAAQEQAEKQFELQKQMFEFNKGNAMYGRDTDAWKWDRQQASNAGQTPGGDFAARPQLNDYV